MYNRTVNTRVDLHESILNLRYINTEPVRELHKCWNKHFEKNPTKGTYLQFCHSQSAILVRNALLSYPQELRQRIFVVAIAPAAYISSAICGKVVHYRAEWYRDLIPRIDFRGAMRCKDTIITLPSHKNASFFDHNFDSPTYASVITQHLKNYISSKGNEI